MPVICLISRTS